MMSIKVKALLRKFEKTISVNLRRVFFREIAKEQRVMNRRKGFTLIELLVVISIIALLMAILIPVLKAAKAAAQGSFCLSNQHSLSMAWFVYATDNRDRLVGGRGTGSRDEPEQWVQYPQKENGTYVSDDKKVAAAPLEDKLRGIERGALFPYVKNIEVYHCPADKRYRRPPAALGYSGTCGGYRSYSIAGCMNGTLMFDNMKDKYHPCTIYTQIKAPAEKYVFVEAADPRGWNIWCWVIDITSSKWEDIPAGWHYNKSSLGFADGHAEMHLWRHRKTIEMINETIWRSVGREQPGNKDLEYMQKHYFVLPGPQEE